MSAMDIEWLREKAVTSGMVQVHRRPEPGIEERVAFPDGSVGERLTLNIADGPVLTQQWRKHGVGMVDKWLEAEQASLERAWKVG